MPEIEGGKFPYVQEWQLKVIDEYEDLLRDTGGNDPRGLLNDFQKPQPNNLMKVNIVRFTLAMGIHTQVALLRVLEREELLARPLLKWLVEGDVNDVQFVSQYSLCDKDEDGYTGVVYRDEDGEVSTVEEESFSYQPTDAGVETIIAGIKAEREHQQKVWELEQEAQEAIQDGEGTDRDQG